MEGKVDFVVKLGGSAVTDKDQFETVNLENIKRAAKVLTESWKHGRRFIVVHGAGLVISWVNNRTLFVCNAFNQSKTLGAMMS